MTDVQIALDLFPGLARLPDGRTMAPVRAIVADDRLLILRSGGPSVSTELDEGVISMKGSSASGFVIHTEAGRVVVGLSGGCRCGAGSLLAYDPFPGRRRIRVAAS